MPENPFGFSQGSVKNILNQLKQDLAENKVFGFNIHINAHHDIEDTTPPGDSYKRNSPTGRRVVEIRIEFVNQETREKYLKDMAETSVWHINKLKEGVEVI